MRKRAPRRAHREARRAGTPPLRISLPSPQRATSQAEDAKHKEAQRELLERELREKQAAKARARCVTARPPRYAR